MRCCIEEKMNTRFLYFTWVVTWFQLNPVRSGKTCATFEFPRLPDLKVVGKENTIINVHFNVKTIHCKDWDNTIINVSKLEGRLKYFRIKCKISHLNRTCTSSEEGLCRCVSPGSYLFIKALHRTDNTQWKWSTDDGSVEEKEIEFNVTYPANVKSLIMEEIKDLTDAKFPTNLSFKCEWENGNPPSTLRLLDTHGKVIGNSTASRTLIQQLYNVTCKDTGIIRCDAEGSIRNTSAPLTLECPPEFINESKHIVVTPGQNVTFSSPIRSHTLAIGLCQMTKFSDDCYQSSLCLSDMCNKTYSCTESKRNEVNNETEAQTCLCALSGIVPNLNLEIFFSKMIVFEYGLWKLIFNNSVGTDLLHVCIQPYSGPPILEKPDWKNISTSVGGSCNVTFSLMQYGLHITGCQIQKSGQLLHESFSSTSYQCRVNNNFTEVSFSSASERPKSTTLEPDPNEDKCSCGVHGTPPYLYLELVFNRVAESDRGLWRLSVSNRNGSGYASINIEVSQGPVSNTSPPLEWVITGSVCGVLTITLILILVLKKFKEPFQDPSQDSPLIQLEHIYYEIHEQSTSAGEDIDEGVFSMKTQNPYKEF